MKGSLCPVCGANRGYKGGDCLNCRVWFSDIKRNIYIENQKLWYQLRDKGLL